MSMMTELTVFAQCVSMMTELTVSAECVSMSELTLGSVCEHDD